MTVLSSRARMRCGRLVWIYRMWTGRCMERGGPRRWKTWGGTGVLGLGKDDRTPGAGLVETLACRVDLSETRELARCLRWRSVATNGRNYVDSAGETERYCASWSASDESSLPQMMVLRKLLVHLPSSDGMNQGFSK